MKKTILLLVNTFPPTGGISAKRSGCFAKYLSRLGYAVYVVRPDMRHQYAVDESVVADMSADVVVYTLQGCFSRAVGFLFDKRKKQCLVVKICYYVCDILYFFKAKKFLSDFIKNTKIDVVFSSAPPHDKFSSYGLGLFVKDKFNIPWICDYRDLITQFSSMTWKMKIYQKLSLCFERQAILRADVVVVVSDSYKPALVKLYNLKNVSIIRNGFDVDDFLGKKVLSKQDKFRILYTGNYYFPGVSFRVLLDAISNLAQKKLVNYNDFSVEFYGGDVNYINEIIYQHSLAKLVSMHALIPNAECKEKQVNATVLLILEYASHEAEVIPGKVFDCLGSKRPVLFIASKKGGCIAEMIEDVNCGASCITVKDVEKLTLQWYGDWKKNGNVVCNSDVAELNKYSRFEQTRKLADIIDFLATNDGKCRT